MITHTGAMKMAIDEAKRGFGFVAPNPPVGCVILDKHDNLLAKGHHRRFGGDHAEIDALNSVKNKADLEGATFYVTLEPCAHEGKTPSCAKVLAKLPIRKVVYGLEDPNPLVCGQGAAILRAAGITAEKYITLQDELEELAEAFLWNHRQRKTFVALKLATSLDGQIGYKSGGPRWLTGEAARHHVHFLRANYDAVLVGKNTVLVDNPKLDIRHPRYPQKKNKVIILDSNASVVSKLPELALSEVHAPEDIFVFVSGKNKVITKHARIIPCSVDAGGQLDLDDVLIKLFSAGVSSVFVEGGAQTANSFLQKKLVQRYYQFVAPLIIGQENGIPLVAGWQPSSGQMPVLHHAQTENFGSDLFISGRII